MIPAPTNVSTFDINLCTLLIVPIGASLANGWAYMRLYGLFWEVFIIFQTALTLAMLYNTVHTVLFIQYQNIFGTHGIPVMLSNVCKLNINI